jgi:hypothetical protein
MNGELEWIWKEVVVDKSRSYPGICLETLCKTTIRLTIVGVTV